MTTVTSATTTTAATTESAATSKLNADFDMFLKLLTAQMQNQDPLDPMDTAQYTQQLVQYSQVEQGIAQNATLKSILQSMGTQDLAQASSLIGRQVQVDSTASALGATPAHWSWSTGREVASLSATIRDSAGRAVETRTLEGGAAVGSFDWNGSLSEGGTASAGTYTLELIARDGAGNDVPVSIESAGVVGDVQMRDGIVQISVGGVQVPLSKLKSVRS